jgi:hypothetical protein
MIALLDSIQGFNSIVYQANENFLQLTFMTKNNRKLGLKFDPSRDVFLL